MGLFEAFYLCSCRIYFGDRYRTILLSVIGPKSPDRSTLTIFKCSIVKFKFWIEKSDMGFSPFSPVFFPCLVAPSDTLIRRSISQQKSGVSITIDDPVRTAKQPSPPRGKLSNIVHVCNLVRLHTHTLMILEMF